MNVGYVRMSAKSLQSCPTLCDPMDCSPAESSVHGMLQAGIMQWVAMPSRGIFLTQGSKPRLFISCIPALEDGFFVCLFVCLFKPLVLPVHFQGKPFNITVIQVSAPAHNAEEAEVEWFYEDLQDLLELTPQKDVLFIIRDWNAKVRGQETPGVTGKFGLGMWKEPGQRLIEFCQENVLVIANTLFQQHKKTPHMDITRWSTPKSD